MRDRTIIQVEELPLGDCWFTAMQLDALANNLVVAAGLATAWRLGYSKGYVGRRNLADAFDDIPTARRVHVFG